MSIIDIFAPCVAGISVVFIFAGLKWRVKTPKPFLVLFLLFNLVIFAIYSYHFEPNSSTDLSRHRYWIDSFIFGKFQAYQNKLISDPMWTQWTYWYLISLTGDSKLVQPITFLLFYGLLIYGTRFAKEKSNIDEKSVSYDIKAICYYCLLLVTVIGFSAVWGSIRMPLAFAISSVVIHRETTLKNRKIPTWLFFFSMIICTFLHVAGIVPYIIYLLSMYLNNKIVKVAVFLSPLLMDNITKLFASSRNLYLNMLDLKISVYQGGEIYRLAKLLYYPEIALLILIAISFMMKLHYRTNKRLKPYEKFYLLFIILAVGSVFNDQVFNRWVWFLVVASFPVIKESFNNDDRMPPKTKGLFNVIRVLIILDTIPLVIYNYRVFCNAYQFVG